MTDTLDLVLLPSVKQGGNPPEWVEQRGGDVRAYDRRSGRSVWGPSHPFQEPSDVILTNGLIRLRVGARGVLPYVDVHAFRDGLWRHTGHLILGNLGSTTQVLVGARLERLTTDVGVVALDVPEVSPLRLELRRGERMIRVASGSQFESSDFINRHIRWDGTPPYVTRSGVTRMTGRFNSGVRVSTRAEFLWPQAASPSSWSVALWWRPDGGSGAVSGGSYGEGPYGEGPYGGSSGQGDAGLMAILDTVGEKVTLAWDSVAGQFELVVPTGQVNVPLTFDSGDDLLLVARFSTSDGLALTVVEDDGTSHHASAPSVTAPATTQTGFRSLRLAESGGVLNGAVIDNPQVYMRWLSSSEAGSLGDATSALDNLPDPEGDLVWHASFDVGPSFSVSNVGSGIWAEPALDGDGFRKGVTVLLNGYGASGLGVTATTRLAEVGAFVATNDSADEPIYHQLQYAALSRQELRLR